MRKKGLEEVQQNIDQVQNGRIQIIGDFKNTYTKVLVKCVNCDLEWMTTAKMLIRSEIGVNCNHHINLTPEMVKKRIYDKTDGTIEMIGDYKGSRTNTLMLCNKCHYEWSTAPYTIYKGHRCPKCVGKARVTTESFKKYVQEKCGTEYLVLSEVKTSHGPIIMKHNSSNCGHVYKTSPHSFFRGGRCTIEAYKESSRKQSIPLNIAQQRLKESWNGEYKIIDNYKKIGSKCTIKHVGGCNKEFSSVIGGLIAHKTGCPHCYHSYGEEATKNYLLKHNYVFKEQFRISECKNIRPLPFDFAVFNNDELAFLIEYQGIQHSIPKFGEKNLKETKMRDKIKYDYCLKNNIHLIRIPYKRWQNFERLSDQVNNYLDKEIN